MIALVWLVAVWLIVMVTIGVFRRWFGRRGKDGE
jgi:hypothetical protein